MAEKYIKSKYTDAEAEYLERVAKACNKRVGQVIHDAAIGIKIDNSQAKAINVLLRQLWDIRNLINAIAQREAADQNALYMEEAMVLVWKMNEIENLVSETLKLIVKEIE